MDSGAHSADAGQVKKLPARLPPSLPHTVSSGTLSQSDGSDSDSDDLDNSFTEVDGDATEQDDEEGWIDTVADSDEEVKFVSLFDDKEFSDLSSMLDYVKDRYSFDFLRVCHMLRLSEYGIIKLTNYIRFEAKIGNHKPNVTEEEMFSAEEYLLPALEDDAMLMNVGDVQQMVLMEYNEPPLNFGEKDGARDKLVEELEATNRNLTAQLELAKNALEQHYEDAEETYGPRTPYVGTRTRAKALKGVEDNADDHYFKSYENNEIHETMLKDTVRTEAYRDFIYGNKDLFKDKVVLDVGCGTGILSMFCARAGAKKVIAVDNSEILHKALCNVWENKLDKVITCLFGKIEEVGLPVKKVDIIISEWMGYCLLYEAMLDTVIFARDKYLAPGGLMIPSHCTLRIAPVIDPDYIESAINFWKSVYGFSMTSMLDSVGDDVAIRQFQPSHIAAASTSFLHLPLHTITREDLSFANHSFSFTLTQDIDALDGFAIWFDTFFCRSATRNIEPEDAEAEAWKGQAGEVAFTTGPGGTGTHWQQGMLLIDHTKGKKKISSLKQGQIITGSIGYSKRQANSRELDIEVKWDAGDADDKGRTEHGRQIWFMR